MLMHGLQKFLKGNANNQDKYAMALLVTQDKAKELVVTLVSLRHFHNVLEITLAWGAELINGRKSLFLGTSTTMVWREKIGIKV